MREVIIGGINYNNYVSDVDFSSGLGEGSQVTITCNPGMPEIAPYTSIIVKQDGKIVFRGYVGAPDQEYDGRPAGLTFAKYQCYDDGVGFKNYLVSGEYVGTPGEVISQVIDYVHANSDNEFTHSVKIQPGIDVTVTLVLTYEGLDAVFDAIAAQMAGYWFVNPQNNTVYFFQDSIADVEGSPITIEYTNVQTPYRHSKLTDQVINKVYVIGGVSQSETKQTWVYDGTQSVFELEESPKDITVLWDGTPVYLVPEGYSGDPYKESDLDAKETYDNDSDSHNPNIERTGYVVVHHIAAKTATKDDLYHWHTDPPPAGRGWSDIGYHWYVKKDGTIIECRPESVIGAHVKGHNSYTIGVAVEGDYERFDTSMPKAQFDALVGKILSIMAEYQLPKKNLLFHGELASTECPGKYFPKYDLRRAVESGSASNYSYTPVTSAAGADSQKRMYYNISEQNIKIIPTYEPAIGTIIEARYAFDYEVNEEYPLNPDTSYTGGRVIPMVISDTGIQSKEEARRIAQAYLKQYSKVQETLELRLVDYQQIYAGDKVYLPWLEKYGLVTTTKGQLRYNTTKNNSMTVEVQLL